MYLFNKLLTFFLKAQKYIKTSTISIQFKPKLCNSRRSRTNCVGWVNSDL